MGWIGCRMTPHAFSLHLSVAWDKQHVVSRIIAAATGAVTLPPSDAHQPPRSKCFWYYPPAVFCSVPLIPSSTVSPSQGGMLRGSSAVHVKPLAAASGAAPTAFSGVGCPSRDAPLPFGTVESGPMVCARPSGDDPLVQTVDFETGFPDVVEEKVPKPGREMHQIESSAVGRTEDMQQVPERGPRCSGPSQAGGLKDEARTRSPLPCWASLHHVNDPLAKHETTTLSKLPSALAVFVSILPTFGSS